MTSNSLKIRSLILTALMVFSVFAGTVARSGSAAAVGNSNNDASVAPDRVSPGQTANHTFEFTATNAQGGASDTLEVTIPAGSFTSADDGLVTDESGNAVTGSTSISDASGTDDRVTLTVDTSSLDDGEDYTVLINGTVQHADLSSTTTANVDFTYSDSGDSTTATDSDALTISEADASASASTFYGGQELEITSDIDGVTANTDYQVRTVEDTDSDDEVGSLRRTITTDSSGVATFELDGRLSEGDFTIVPANDQTQPIDLDGDNTRGTGSEVNQDQFEVVAQDLSTAFDDESVGNDGGEATVEFDIASDVRSTYLVNVSAQGDLDTGELSDIFDSNKNDWTVVTEYDEDDTITVRADGSATAEQEETLDFTDIDAGEYTFETNVTDSLASDSSVINVTDTGDESADFANNVESEERGDVVNITVQLDNTDEAIVQVGNPDSVNYYAWAEITDDDDDGVAYVEFNSYEAGTDGNNPSDVLTAGDDDTTIDGVDQGGTFTTSRSDDSDILEDADYNMYVAAGQPSERIDGDAPSANADADNRGTLRLTERSTDRAQIWTAPAEDDSTLQGLDSDDPGAITEFVAEGNLTQSSTIANGDVVVVEVQASGIEGILATGSDTTSAYQAASDGTRSSPSYPAAASSGGPFSLSIEEESGAANTGSTNLLNVTDISSSDINVVQDQANNTHYVVLDSEVITSGTGELTYEDGDGYVANFTVDSDNSDLAGDSQSVTDDFTVEDVEVELDANANDFIVAEAADNQEITGDTNVAAGTNVTVDLNSESTEDPFLKQPEAVVQSDGTFTIIADFGENEVGTNFTAQANIDGTDQGDEFDGYLVEATEEPETEEPTDDGTATEEPTAPPEETDEPTEEETTMGEMTDEEETTMAGTDAEETTTGSGGPGFTAAIALIALVAAALLAVRRDN